MKCTGKKDLDVGTATQDLNEKEILCFYCFLHLITCHGTLHSFDSHGDKCVGVYTCENVNCISLASRTIFLHGFPYVLNTFDILMI